VSQTSFVSLLVRFHFFFLVLALGLLREPGLDFIAEEMGSPCRVGAILAFFQLFISRAF